MMAFFRRRREQRLLVSHVPSDDLVAELLREAKASTKDVDVHLRPKRVRAEVWRKLHEQGFKYFPIDIDARVLAVLREERQR